MWDIANHGIKLAELFASGRIRHGSEWRSSSILIQ